MKVIYTETVPNRVNLDHTYHSQYSLGIRPLHAEGLVLRQVKYYWIVLTRTINTILILRVTQCAEHHDNNVVLGNDPQMYCQCLVPVGAA